MIVWQAHRGKIESVVFSPDGRFLATATGGTQMVYLWEPTTGKLLSKLTGDWPDGRRLGTVQSVAFAPDTPLLAAGTTRCVTVWRAGTWELLADLDLDYAHELAFGPGEVPLLAASNAGVIGLWADPGRSAEGVRAPDRLISTSGGVASMNFSPDGRLLATSTSFNINLRDVANGRRVRHFHNRERERLRLPSALNGDTGNRGEVRFSPDGSRLAMAYGRWLEVHPVDRKAKEVLRIEAGTGLGTTVSAVCWTSNGRSLLTAARDGLVREWDANTGGELRSFDWGIGKLYCAAFSPDGLTCAAGSKSGQVVLWDMDL